MFARLVFLSLLDSRFPGVHLRYLKAPRTVGYLLWILFFGWLRNGVSATAIMLETFGSLIVGYSFTFSLKEKPNKDSI